MTADLCAVIVTYNRGNDLMKCLTSLMSQSVSPAEIVIVNNVSPDNTEQLLTDAQYIDLSTEPVELETGALFAKSVKNNAGHDVTVKYLKKHTNDGGAGGFYAGMKTAFDGGRQWVILMDDDGLPHRDEIKEMLSGAERHGLKYCNALVINIDNRDELAFSLFDGEPLTAAYTNRDIVPGAGSPFNGTLIHRSLIEEIGFIKREMWLWGDEAEYTARARKAGHPIATICRAHHYHPKTGRSQNIFPGINRWRMLPPTAPRARIFYRNHCYIYATYSDKRTLHKFIYKNLLGAFLNLQWKQLPKMLRAMNYGKKGDFTSPLY